MPNLGKGTERLRFFTRFWQCFAGDDLQQEHELQAIAEVLLDVLDLSSGLSEVRVHPGGERLKRGF